MSKELFVKAEEVARNWVSPSHTPTNWCGR